jgi:hypothetical protein
LGESLRCELEVGWHRLPGWWSAPCGHGRCHRPRRKPVRYRLWSWKRGCSKAGARCARGVSRNVRVTLPAGVVLRCAVARSLTRCRLRGHVPEHAWVKRSWSVHWRGRRVRLVAALFYFHFRLGIPSWEACLASRSREHWSCQSRLALWFKRIRFLAGVCRIPWEQTSEGCLPLICQCQPLVGSSFWRLRTAGTNGGGSLSLPALPSWFGAW